MVFRKIQTIDNAWKFENKGDQVQGVLIKIKKEVGINKSLLYTLEIEPKKEVSVWGSAVLDNKMKDIKIGSLIQIVYKGEKKNYHDFDVFLDDGVQEKVTEVKDQEF